MSPTRKHYDYEGHCHSEYIKRSEWSHLKIHQKEESFITQSAGRKAPNARIPQGATLGKGNMHKERTNVSILKVTRQIIFTGQPGTEPEKKCSQMHDEVTIFTARVSLSTLTIDHNT